MELVPSLPRNLDTHVCFSMLWQEFIDALILWALAGLASCLSIDETSPFNVRFKISDMLFRWSADNYRVI
jgi:hypothetical protein